MDMLDWMWEHREAIGDDWRLVLWHIITPPSQMRGITQLSAELGQNRRTIQRKLKRLRDCGLLKCAPNSPGQAVNHRLNLNCGDSASCDKDTAATYG